MSLPVRAIGQVELLITLGVSALFFKEKISRIEIIAVLLLGASYPARIARQLTLPTSSTAKRPNCGIISDLET